MALRACPLAPPPHPGAAARVFARHFCDTQRRRSASSRSAAEVNDLFGTPPGLGLDSRPPRAGAGPVRLVRPGLRRRRHRVPTESDTIPARGLRLDGPHFLTPDAADGRILVAPLRGWRRALGTVVLEGKPQRSRRTAVRRRGLRLRPAVLVRARERAAARGSPAAATSARRHVQLAHRSRRRHRHQHAGGADERRVRRARRQLEARGDRSAACRSS